MNDLRNELIDLSQFFHGTEREYILAIAKQGDDEQVEGLIYECNEKLEGVTYEVLPD